MGDAASASARAVVGSWGAAATGSAWRIVGWDTQLPRPRVDSNNASGAHGRGVRGLRYGGGWFKVAGLARMAPNYKGFLPGQASRPQPL